MELKRISKKLIASLMLTIIVLAQFSNYRFVTEAAVIAKADSLKLALSEKNPETNWGYSINGNKKIWNIVDKTTGKSGSNLYCIKAEYGETWLGTPTTTVTYDKSYNAYELSSTNLTTSNTANTLIKSTANYSALLWIADNVFMPGENKTTFLSKMGITWDADEEMYVLPNTDLIGEEEFPTDDDIIAVQQAAIWYYTNYKVGSDSTYNLLNNDSWLKYIANGTTDYNQLSQNANYGEG
ncbi:MAG: Cys-Gln thioester bond-forming surface protein, partial [Clostridia bacterium]|nr:Cys-Gln thioester bond-forming surface protein [Clostridia bacterium]